jgi:muconate cycloisomerase
MFIFSDGEGRRAELMDTLQRPIDNPVITTIELTPIKVPFHSIVREAMKSAGGLGMMIPAEEEWLGGDFVICKLIVEDGSFGLGEQFVWLPETGVSPNQIIDAIQNALYLYVLGESPFNLEHIRHRMHNNVARNETAKGLIDMAAWDLIGRITERPSCCLMGGSVSMSIPMGVLIPLMDEESMSALALDFQKSGVRTFRFKLGRSIDEDIHIIKSVREKLGTDARIRVDYNQAYTPDLAIRAIRAIEPFGIDVAEQPVRASDWLGMAHVQKHVLTPLMAHEGCFSLTDVIAMAEMGAIRVIGINSERPGGITDALRALTYAEMRGLGVVIHNQTLGIASSAQIHLAAARYHSLGHDPELFGHIMFEDDLIVNPIAYANGTVTVPAGAGWGVDLDEEALARYATRETIKISQP